jgi:hypothetical protein
VRGRRAALVAALSLGLLMSLPAAARPAANSLPTARGKIAGMGVSPPATPGALSAAEYDRLASDGINTVMIDVWWDVEPGPGSVVHPGSRTESDADLMAQMALATSRGLQVYLEPKFWCPSCLGTGVTWRGSYQPADLDRFFTSYALFVGHYADIARLGGADTYFVGSELSRLEGQTSRWRTLIADARSRFTGRLAYETNWGDLSQVRFWDALDVIGVSAYFPLSDAAHPSVPALKRAWHRADARGPYHGRNWYAELRGLSRRWHRPVLFGESGYLSSTYAAQNPSNVQAQYELDEQAQANAYRALLDTFQRESWWQGVVWWEWGLGSGTTYTPRGKLAEGILKNAYAGPA